jgi:hypothetical protein
VLCPYEWKIVGVGGKPQRTLKGDGLPLDGDLLQGEIDSGEV